MARRLAKGSDELDRHGEEERGKTGVGPVGRLACWADSGEMG
jgi:hypothetical protein